MNYTNLHYQTGTQFLCGIGPKRTKEIVQKLDSIESLYFETPKKLEKKTGIRASVFNRMNRKQALEKSAPIVNFHLRNNIDSHFFLSDTYPERLKQCDDGPLMLYAKGNIHFEGARFVSVVGTRNSTHYGQEICRSLISSFIGKNIVVVSGLAYGIDAIAHQFCLDNNVPTIAVLGHGLDRIYPSIHQNLARNIIRSGALITEFTPNTMPDRENFPKRNRIVAGMCDATIVVESKKKGGSLITALLANDYNRDVFAFPGNITQETSQGCNTLIANNQAHLIQSPDEFLVQMGWESRKKQNAIQRKLFNNLTKEQQTIVHYLIQNGESSIDHLSLSLKFPVSKMHHELFQLELNGIVLSTPGSKYQII